MTTFEYEPLYTTSPIEVAFSTDPAKFIKKLGDLTIKLMTIAEAHQMVEAA